MHLAVRNLLSVWRASKSSEVACGVSTVLYFQNKTPERDVTLHRLDIDLAEGSDDGQRENSLVVTVCVSTPIVEFSTMRLRRGFFLNNSASICVGSHAR